MASKMRFRADHNFARENLSAYLDSELDQRAMRRVSQHLDACEECQRELAELRQTVALLQALPRIAVPRSFVLPAAAQPIQRAQKRWNLAFSLARVGTVVATALLVVSFAGDALFRVGGQASLPAAFAPQTVMTEQMEEAAEPEAAMPEGEAFGKGVEQEKSEQPLRMVAPTQESETPSDSGEGELAIAAVEPAEEQAQAVAEAPAPEVAVATNGEGEKTAADTERAPVARTTGAGPTAPVCALAAESSLSPEPEAKGGGGLPPTPVAPSPTAQQPTPAPTLVPPAATPAEDQQVVALAVVSPSPETDAAAMAAAEQLESTPEPQVSRSRFDGWLLWRVVRYVLYGALALLCFSLALLIWSAHKRRT